MKNPNLLAQCNPLGPALQRLFCQYLIGQRNLSPQTISAYRDTFKLLIHFLERRFRKNAVNARINCNRVLVQGFPLGFDSRVVFEVVR